MQVVESVGTIPEDDIVSLFSRVERTLWDEARGSWRGWTGATLEDPYGTQIVKHEGAARMIWDAVLQAAPALESRFESTKTVTISKNGVAIERHRDNPLYEGDWKLLLYANAASDGDVAGTRFFPHGVREPPLDIPYSVGAVTLFRMDIEHEGARIPAGVMKRTLGLRLKAK